MNRSRRTRASLRAIALRWLLAAFLLVAQQGALTHALSHAGRHAHEAATLHADAHHASHAAFPHKEAHGQAVSEQCAFDLLYSQVLGGVHAGHSLRVSASDAVALLVAVAQSFSATTRIPYDSRGPPAIS